MRVEQIYELLNTSTNEILGEETVLQEDLSNIVDIGNEIINQDKVDNYVKKLVNRIGKTVFKNRVYTGNVPSILMDSWEFGSILQKVTAELPEAEVNETWELENGREYKTDIFYQPEVSAKFFNSKITFEIPMSFTEKQVKESFTSAAEMNGFLSMLTTAIANSMTVRINNLIMKTINNMTAETLADSGTNRAINLAEGFENTEGLTLETAFTNDEFVKHVAYQIKLYRDRLTNISTLFNIGGKERFTPKSELRTVLLSEFATASEVYLQSDTINKELTGLTDFESVPFWQGSGTEYSLQDTTSINVKSSTGEVVEQSGIIGVMFDKEAVGVANVDERVTTNYNPKAEFYTNYYKFDAGYYNDMNENFIVFYVDFGTGEPVE